MAFVIASFGLAFFLGENFFPAVDAGEIYLHVRAPIGTRIEETAALFDHIEQKIRSVIPPDQTGFDRRQYRPAGQRHQPRLFQRRRRGPRGRRHSGHAERQITTRPRTIVKTLRTVLPRAFPGSSFAFLPADIVSQILNFGAPAPIDVMVAGPNRAENEAYAKELMRSMANVPGATDVRLQQSSHYPELAVDVDRTRADQLGVTERDVTNSLVVNLAGSFQVAPAFWLSPRTGVSYPIVAQTPQYQIDSLSKMENIPVTGSEARQTLRSSARLSTIHRENSDAVVSHYAIQPAFDIYATTQGRDLGAVAGDIQKVIDRAAAERPKGSTVTLRGQVETMNTAFSGLFFGLAEADRPDLSADRGQLSVLDRSLRDHHGACRRRWRASSGRCSRRARRSACRL